MGWDVEADGALPVAGGILLFQREMHGGDVASWEHDSCVKGESSWEFSTWEILGWEWVQIRSRRR